MVLHSYLGRHQCLIHGAAQAFGKRSRCHRGGNTYFSLAAAHGSRDSCPFFIVRSYLACDKEELDNFIFIYLLVAKTEVVHQHSRDHPSSTICRRGDYPTKGRIFFIYCNSQATDPIEYLLETVRPAQDGLYPSIGVLI